MRLLRPIFVTGSICAEARMAILFLGGDPCEVAMRRSSLGRSWDLAKIPLRDLSELQHPPYNHKLPFNFRLFPLEISAQ